jgi:phage terminase Nu1 subunit (DNA packaging protein)
MAATWELILAKDGKTLATELARELSHVAAARQAVGRQLDLLYAYLRDPEPEIRRSVASTLGYFPESAVRILPDLRAAHRDETDEETREALGMVIDGLTRNNT